MIRFSLKCKDGHGFESWFQSGSAFEALQSRGLLECAICGTNSVEKAIMAPRVSSGDRPSETAAPETPPPAPEHPVAVSGGLQPDTPLAQALTKLRQEVEKNSDYVGDSFSDEARKIHLGESPQRAIYGEARLDEAKSLIDDGIDVVPLPFRSGPKSN